MNWTRDPKDDHAIWRDGEYRAEVWEDPQRPGRWLAGVRSLGEVAMATGQATEDVAKAWCEAEIGRRRVLREAQDGQEPQRGA